MSERLLTYRQIGDEFGLSPQAVRKRVHRMGLRKVPGNDGKVRVAIPDGMVFQASRDHEDDREDGHEDGRVSVREDGLVDALRQQIRALQGDMTEERAARLAAETRAARAEGALAQVEAAQQRLEAALTEERTARRALEAQAVDDALQITHFEAETHAMAAAREGAWFERDAARRDAAQAEAQATAEAERAAGWEAAAAEAQARAQAAEETLAEVRARPWWRRIAGF